VDRRTLLTIVGLALIACSVFAAIYLARYGSMCSPSALGVAAPLTPAPAIFRGVASDLPVLEALVAAGGKIGKPDKAELLRISQEDHSVDGVQCDLKVLDLSVEVGLTALIALTLVLAQRKVKASASPM
jgi:hypothetical protein